MDKKVIYSAAQPSVEWLTLGNYLGALKNWVKLGDDPAVDSIFAIADLHSVTVRQVPADLRRRTLSFVAQYIAMGLDPEKHLLYVQSHVSAHARLAWLLNCFTYVGEASRMTQFKEKSARHADNINMGLMTYPILQAADILLYGTHFVPVGEDQRQHIELTRDLAERFNNAYSPTFVVPEAYIQKAGAKIMDLQYPEKKMSKSTEAAGGSIFFGDTSAEIIKKINRAVTDSDSEIKLSDEKPGIKNLLTIYSACRGIDILTAEAEFLGKSYAEFKKSVGEAVVDLFAPMQKEYQRLMADKAYLQQVLKDGAERADYLSNKMLAKVMKKMGFNQ